MKKIMYGCIAILLVVGSIMYGFISAPKVIAVDRQYEATAYKLEDKSFSQPVTLSLSGVFDEKSESYLGKLTVNGKEYTNCRLDTKFAMMKCTVDGNEGVPLELLGMVYADKDFKAWSLTVDKSNNSGQSENDLYTVLNRGDSTEGNIVISLAATDRGSALKQYDHLRQSWANEMERRSK
ncbi:hypothetical protein PaeBR_16895 [Paenibacillus sp. BR2-3]|uniref:hypothetical protein n=1 Tax=Paenibacillus sp. BR2-3 TaxID=3048494 RepID=UPI00397762EF